MKWLADQGMSTTDYVDKLRTICPICGKPDWCSFLHQVYYNDETGEIYNAEFVLCQRVNANQVAGFDGNYYTFINTTTKGVNKYEEVNSSYRRLDYFKKEYKESFNRAKAAAPVATKKVNIIENPVAKDSRLNEVYTEFLNLLHLEKYHQSHFYEEKWDDSMIADFGVKSLPPSENTYFLSKKDYSLLSDYDKKLVDYVKKSTYIIGRRMITDKLVKKVGDLTGVPGFCIIETKKSGKCWTFVGDPGFCFPQRNIKGEIVRLIVRADEPYHISRDGKKRGKYKAFSSYYKVKEETESEITIKNGYENGCSATPRAGYYLEKEGVLKNPFLMITEGGKKAFVANRKMNMSVAAISGVNAYDDVINDLEEIKKLDVDCIVEAYDVDKFVKEGVENAQANLINELKKSSFEIYSAYWDGYMGKGLDDVLLNNYIPKFVQIK
ncbi:MAG: DUF3854 domain-containing protein [Candidatus Pacebacteria bacterium]|nr:DUF3854 domain-containing protein [Candidatus Paceibacterota bacterium]